MQSKLSWQISKSQKQHTNSYGEKRTLFCYRNTKYLKNKMRKKAKCQLLDFHSIWTEKEREKNRNVGKRYQQISTSRILNLFRVFCFLCIFYGLFFQELQLFINFIQLVASFIFHIMIFLTKRFFISLGSLSFMNFMIY